MRFFAPLSDSFAADPYPAYAALREQEGLHYYPDFDIWLVSRFAEVQAVAFDKNMVRSLDGLIPPEEIAARKRAGNWHDMPHHARFVQVSMLDSDGPAHDRLRAQVFKLFTPVMIDGLRDSIEATVEG